MAGGFIANSSNSCQCATAVASGALAPTATGLHASRTLHTNSVSGSGSQVREAEMSVEFLCRKFESLSDQLRREEAAREAAERRSKVLQSEVESAEDFVARHSSALAVELSATDSSLAALRASAGGAGHRAAMQAERVREEHAASSRLEHRCAQLAEDFRAEVARFDGASARLAAQEKEAVQEQCEHGDLTRRLRQVQSDMRVSSEDLRIAQQRSMLVQNEHQSLERTLEATRSQTQSCNQECETQGLLLVERQRHLTELEARLKELSETVDITRGDNLNRDRQLATMQEDEKAAQAQLISMQQEAVAQKHEKHARSTEVQAESEVSNILHEEFKVIERQRLSDAQESSLYLRRVSEAEAALGVLQQSVEQAHVTRESLSRHLEQLTIDEHHHASAARGLSQTRHAEDLAFEDVQGELQAAFRRRDALADDLAVHRRSRDALLEQLRRLQPEINEADERCRHLEVQLASRAREIEEELVHQRYSQEEVSAITDAIRRMQRQELEFEAELQIVSSADFLCSSSAAVEGCGWHGRSSTGLTDQRPAMGTYSAPHTPRQAEAVSDFALQWHGGASSREGGQAMRSTSPSAGVSRHHYVPSGSGCVRSPSPVPRLGSNTMALPLHR